MTILSEAIESLKRQIAERIADDASTPCLLSFERAQAVLIALAEPEQEPVAWMNTQDDLIRHHPVCYGFDPENWVPLYTTPTPPPDTDCHLQGVCQRSGYSIAPTPRKPQREHITDGSPCWCNPDVIEEEGGNVIVHNYEDNWQQYAKPGETAQQCIERHRGEQDALMKLYATPRKPQTTHWEGCEAVHPECKKENT